MDISGAVILLTDNINAWFYILPGLIIGLVFGAIPGISVTMAMALFLPMTLYMDFLSAIIFLTSIYTGAGFGGSVPAILMKIPGTSSAVSTTFDGYPMAERGLHNEALGYALTSSTLGMFLAYVVLLFLIGPISSIVLYMGPIEMTLVAIWGVLLLGSLAGKSVSRGLLAGVFGLLVGTVGINTAGHVRGTMGVNWLFDGIPIVPAIIGLLAASQLFSLVGSNYLVASEANRKPDFRKVLLGVRQALYKPLIMLRGSLIGAFIGAIPGVGSSIANLISYSEARRYSKDPDSFGSGNPDGVIAAESANSSSEGGAMATMLSLGIPGGGATAILLVAFSIHGVVGGPRFIRDELDTVYAIILINLFQAPVLLIIGFIFVLLAASIVKLPIRILVPIILVVATFGSFSFTGNMSGPWTMLIFAIIGWLSVKYHYPTASIVIGLILGRILETQLLRAYQITRGDFSIVLSRPAAVILMIVLSLSILFSIYKAYKNKKSTKIEN